MNKRQKKKQLKRATERMNKILIANFLPSVEECREFFRQEKDHLRKSMKIWERFCSNGKN